MYHVCYVESLIGVCFVCRRLLMKCVWLVKPLRKAAAEADAAAHAKALEAQQAQQAEVLYSTFLWLSCMSY